MPSAVQLNWIFVFKVSFEGVIANAVFLGRSINFRYLKGINTRLEVLEEILEHSKISL